MKKPKFSHCDYMGEKCTHREYYAQFVTQSIKNTLESHFGIDRLVASQDPSFNDIPLAEWDTLCRISDPRLHIPNQFDDGRPGYAHVDAICLLKEAARQMVEHRQSPNYKAPIKTEVRRAFATPRAWGYAPGSKITITAKLYSIGDQKPYFSVTAEVKEPRARDFAACGCMHDEILHVWPEIAPVVALHLSDIDGQPMHAKANGWYWLAGVGGGMGEKYHGGQDRTPKECLRILSDHLRLRSEDAAALVEAVKAQLNPRAYFAEWVAARAKQWKAEADEAIAFLQTLAG